MNRLEAALGLCVCAALSLACQAEPIQHTPHSPSADPLLIDPVTGEPYEQSLHGIVVDADGQPLRARVHLVTATGSQSTSTNAKGLFQFFDLSSDAYAMTVTTQDGRIATLANVKASPEALRVPLTESGAKLALTMRGRPGTRFAVSSDETRLYNFTAREGVEAEVVIPRGEVLVRLYGENFSDERVLTSKPRAEYSVSFSYDD